MKWGLSVATAVLLAPTATALAQRTDQLRNELRGVRVDEKLGAQVPMSHEFTDDRGRAVRLATYAGQPMVLSLNYMSCPMLCSMQLAGVAKTLSTLDWAELPQFSLIALSIDPHESVGEARRAQEIYVGQSGSSRQARERWHFLVSGDEAAIRSVADAVGFRYRYDAVAKEFRHVPTLIFLTPDGRVSGYIHGIDYPAPDFQRAIRRAARGEIASGREQEGVVGFLMNCFSYDPKSRAPLAMLIMRGTGLLIVFLIAFFLGRHFLRERRKRRGEASSASTLVPLSGPPFEERT